MADLSVKVAGVSFNNPLIAASGTFGFGREYGEFYPLSKLGGISCKGITLKRRDGNPPPRIAETPSGILNAVGLQNPGVDVFIKEDLPWLREQGTVVIANIAGNTVEEYCMMAEKLSETDTDMIELNISCPNVKSGGVQFGTSCESVGNITKEVRAHCKKPLIVKLSPNVTDIASIAQAAEAEGADDRDGSLGTGVAAGIHEHGNERRQDDLGGERVLETADDHARERGGDHEEGEPGDAVEEEVEGR